MNDALEHRRAIEFTSYMMMKIKQATASDDFLALVDNSVVIDELLQNYGFYHMYPPAGVIELLAECEPLIRRLGLTEIIR